MLSWYHEANRDPGGLLSPAFCPRHSRKTIWSPWGEPDAEAVCFWVPCDRPG